jgi:Calcineurin-like phosphoesterase
MYDLIGDIHGHADELEGLLLKLGYAEINGVYRHPERQALFLGDFIDRGPKIKRVLQVARSMVEGGAAKAILGNHELNALAFHTSDPKNPGKYMRSHSEKNLHQHQATLSQLSRDDLKSYLDWFRTLPFSYELNGLRAVHACWDEKCIELLKQSRPEKTSISDAWICEAYDKKTELFSAVETVLKGRESQLPAGLSFGDKDGSKRTLIRVRWYLPPNGHTYRTYALQADEIDCDEPLSSDVCEQAKPYPKDAPPIFFGHYWLRQSSPSALAPNVACLDYSVAKKGMLCAYQWHGEQTLDDKKFLTVPNGTCLSTLPRNERAIF